MLLCGVLVSWVLVCGVLVCVVLVCGAALGFGPLVLLAATTTVEAAGVAPLRVVAEVGAGVATVVGVLGRAPVGVLGSAPGGLLG